MAKNANGAGSITRRKSDGLYMGRYTVQTDTGPKRKTLYRKSYEECRIALTKAMADADRGLVYDDEGLTLSMYMTRWLEDSVKDSVKTHTYNSYEQITRIHIIPAIGGVKLKNLKPAHLQGLYRAKLDGGLSPRTVQYIHTTVHRALKIAVRWELIPRNVADAVQPPRIQRKEMRCFNKDEAKKLLETAKGERYEAVYVLAVHSGLRKGEILGLSWDAVNFDKGTLQVRRTLAHDSNGNPVFSTPKTSKSRRTIHLSRTVLSALSRHRKRQNQERLRAGTDWHDYGIVFATEMGTPVHASHLHDRSWKPLLRHGGLPDIRFHDLRHTCATLLLGAGVHVKIVSELLGHASIAITLDTYSHVLPSMGDTASVAMESALS